MIISIISSGQLSSFAMRYSKLAKKTNKQTNTLTVHGQFEDINKIILLLCNAWSSIRL